MDLTSIYILIIAFALDAIFGDPKKLPHLIVGYGNSISFGEKKLNKGASKVLKGALLTILLVGISFVLPYLIIRLLNTYNFPILSLLFSILMLFYCLANKTLIKEGYAVFNTLKNEGLEAGRKRLSWIVGRETDNLSEQQIRIATLETMSENLSDGVIAPLFYFLILGIPGVMAYKMINTLDSMIGYKNDRYISFGKFAAKLDDVANYIPARITALLMLVVQFKLSGISFVFKEGKKHSSPNAGYPEAALAYILDCQFGGPNYYHGKLLKKPFIGSNNRVIKHEEIKTVSRINYAVSILFCLLSIAILLLFQNV
ncbi:adenosylcobinamide-phosphate synthase CbiB [Polaribacter sp. Q13]|uniref:adenosylcobinamide-phosphate synthase CbiB n=1 Tax=Polaribacter sp. Q13 TaxID=2806551 RepID=UPI00193BBFD2|nr:adenosylcobinamide-phosphate synthase CbiB [Polaribacter sp. Q13]QVY65964.1 cobalamin biosynthesis protein CobD [Polaribacter sp. Q13]